MNVDIRTRRVYDDPAGSASTDGFRIFADRLWPRGESKSKFHYDLWAKSFAPSAALRKWFHAAPAERWEQFKKRYLAELTANPGMPAFVAELRRHPRVTLLFGSRNLLRNNAVILAAYLHHVLNA